MKIIHFLLRIFEIQFSTGTLHHFDFLKILSSNETRFIKQKFFNLTKQLHFARPRSEIFHFKKICRGIFTTCNTFFKSVLSYEGLREKNSFSYEKFMIGEVFSRAVASHYRLLESSRPRIVIEFRRSETT